MGRDDHTPNESIPNTQNKKSGFGCDDGEVRCLEPSIWVWFAICLEGKRMSFRKT